LLLAGKLNPLLAAVLLAAAAHLSMTISEKLTVLWAGLAALWAACYWSRSGAGEEDTKFLLAS
jgi:hypothetical protein